MQRNQKQNRKRCLKKYPLANSAERLNMLREMLFIIRQLKLVTAVYMFF